MFPLATSGRIVSTAGSLSLASLIAFTGIAQATAVPAFSHSLTGDTLRASVTGNERTGVWRVRVISPAGNRRVDFVLRSGDINWAGAVRVSYKQGNSWSLVKQVHIDQALAGGPSVAGCNAGVCWDTSLFKLPHDGDARFAVSVQLMRGGTYQVSGGVRQASEAFIYDHWLTSGSQPVTH